MTRRLGATISAVALVSVTLGLAALPIPSEGAPVYSPDGSQIAFALDHHIYTIEGAGGHGRIYKIVVMNVNGNHKHTIRSGIPHLYGIGWQPLPG